MSLPDGPMRQYFTLLTDLPLAEVDRLLGPDVNPRDAKEVLGQAVVAQYHGDEAARGAAGLPQAGQGARPGESARRCYGAAGGGSEIAPAPSSGRSAWPQHLRGESRLVEEGAVKIGPDREPLAPRPSTPGSTSPAA